MAIEPFFFLCRHHNDHDDDDVSNGNGGITFFLYFFSMQSYLNRQFFHSFFVLEFEYNGQIAKKLTAIEREREREKDKFSQGLTKQLFFTTFILHIWRESAKMLFSFISI